MLSAFTAALLVIAPLDIVPKVVLPKLLEFPDAVILPLAVTEVADKLLIVVLPKLLEFPEAIMLALLVIAPLEIVPIFVMFCVPMFSAPVMVPPARGSLAAIEFVTVVLKLASSFRAAAISLSVLSVLGAESMRLDIAEVTYSVVAILVELSEAL